MTNYLTGTRDGERKRGKGKKGKHQHQHTQPRARKPWKGKGEKKADGQRAKHRPEEGGVDGSAWHNLQDGSQNLPAREGPKPDLEREHTWDRGPMGN